MPWLPVGIKCGEKVGVIKATANIIIIGVNRVIWLLIFHSITLMTVGVMNTYQTKNIIKA